jgi:hypothetical protein
LSLCECQPINKGRTIKCNLIHCLCGCNELILSKDKNGRIYYKKGHMPKSIYNSIWNGGIRKKGNYFTVYRPNHRFADNEGYVLYHRIVYESFHKCCLLQWTDVHHLDHNTRNNFPSNLKAITRNQHMSIHVKHNWNNGVYNHVRDVMSGRFISIK